MKKLLTGLLTLCTAATFASSLTNTAQSEARQSADHAKKALEISTTNAQANAYNTTENIKDKAQDAWQTTKDTAQDAGTTVKDKAENAWEYVKDKAEDTGEYVQDKASDAAQATGNVFQKFGNWLYSSIWMPVKNMFSAKKAETNQAKEVTVTYNPNK